MTTFSLPTTPVPATRARARFATAGAATLALALALALAACATAQAATSTEDLDALGRMSLEELAGLVVTSASKQPQPLASAPAALFVITRQDLERSGAATLPEALALAPNLQVVRSGAQQWQVGARGLAGNAQAQNFPNKLLVLIDGRSVWSPLFSGVYWDSQDVPLDDVERIEVISGPGASLWGANAFNGVVNVITRSARDTPGVRVQALAGSDQRVLEGRLGGSIGSAAARVYAKARDVDAFDGPAGTPAGDGGTALQAGFRMDAADERDAWTLQGDVLRVRNEQGANPDLVMRGANVLARWQRTLTSGGDLQLQGYVDDVDRSRETQGAAFRIRTWDLQLQHAFAWGERQRLVWGAGLRAIDYSIETGQPVSFRPPSRRTSLANAFAQDTIALTPRLSLALGLKLERDPYRGSRPLPDVRLAWQASPDRLWWLAASRAIRSPTPFDVDVVETLGPVEFIRATRDFRAERVEVLQAGFRGRLAERLTLSVTAFRNEYDDLRTVETASRTAFLPLRWGNGLAGHAFGAEAWATWQVTEHWRLAPAGRWVRKHLYFDGGTVQLLGVDQAGLDARGQVSLTSSWDLGPVSVDAAFRHQSPVREAGLDAWSTLDLRVGWRLAPSVDVALIGRNLLASSHVESTVPGAAAVGREARIAATWRW